MTVDEAQLNQLITSAIFSQERVAQLLTHAHSLRTDLSSDRLETGAVVNLADIPLEELPTELQTGLTQLKSVAPMLANRDIYIGLIAKPQIKDGQLSLGQDLNLQFGQFVLPVADMASSLGLSMQELEQKLNQALISREITVSNLEIRDEQLVITGTQP